MSELNNLVFKILGSHLKGEYEYKYVNTVEGSTYNWVESPLPHNVILSYGENAPMISMGEALDRINELVSEDKPLPTATVEAIYDLNKLLPSNTIRYELVKNRELKVRLMAQDVHAVIKSDIVYNVLFYLVTGKTTYVRTFREFRRVMHDSDGIVGNVDYIEKFLWFHTLVLAQYYRRNRSLLLYVKNKLPVSKGTRSLINRISKASRVVNKPTSNKNFKDVPLSEKSTLELEKMLGASDVITVRNGRKFKVEGRAKEPYNHDRLLLELAYRDDVYTPEQLDLRDQGWKLAIPTGPKKALGNIPNGSSVKFTPGDKVGVRWYSTDKDDRNAYVDLDLSIIASDGDKFGWNGFKNGNLSFSGDMTKLVNGEAYEEFIINDDKFEGVISLDSYNYGTSNELKVELYVGDQVIPITEPNSAMFLGIIHDGRFYVNYQEYGNAEVAVASLTSFDYLL